MKPLTASDLEQMIAGLQASAGAVSAKTATISPSPGPTSRLGQVLSTPTQDDLDTLEVALTYISSDVLRGSGTIIGSDGAPVPDYWLGVIFAARRDYGDAAKEIARRWSQLSPRYRDGSGFEQAWAQFKPDHPNPVRIGSVFMLAKSMGWPGAAGAKSLVRNSSCPRFQLLDRGAIMAQPPLRWRVKGLFPETGIGAIYGPSASGKSFLAGDMGVRIAFGEDWFGHRTLAAPVTYIMLEGEAGLRNRIAAWEAHNGKIIPSGFRAMTQPFQLAEPDQVEELGAILPQGGVVIIDTLNRAAPGLDENSSQDMGRILAGAKRLQEITGGLVLIVHHTGKDVSKGIRGHSSLLAALDGAIEVERSQAGRSWSAAKVKDGEDGRQVAFKLHVVDLGVDVDGDPVTSCAVGSDMGAIFRQHPPTGKNQLSALTAVRKALSASTVFGQGGADQRVACVTFEDALAAAADAVVGVETKRRVTRAREALQGLIDGNHLRRGLDHAQREWVWL